MIEFEINGQSVKRIDSTKVIAYATSLVAKFNFLTSEWNNNTITAFFSDSFGNTYKQLLTDDGTCVIPHEVLQNKFHYFYVGAAIGDIITTNKVKVNIYDSCYEDNVTISDPTDDIYTQIIKKIDSIGGGGTSGGGSNIASDVKYSNNSLGDITSVKDALDVITSKVFYIAPIINSFTINPNVTTYEIGKTINTLTLSWNLNKSVSSQTLTGCSITSVSRSAIYSQPLSSDKTFTLTVNDGTQSISKSIKVSFLPKIYYGAASIPAHYDSDFILRLSNNKLVNSKNGTYTFTTGVDQYAFIVYPKSFGVAKCNIGGFDTDLELVTVLNHENESGYKQEYYIYRTMRSNLGSFNMILS